MMRSLIVCCVVLAALCGLQWKALRDLKRELAHARVHTSMMELEQRADETVRTLSWLDAHLRAAGGPGLCPGGSIDLEPVRRLVLGTYLQRRATGASELEARAEVLKAAGDTPDR